MSKTPSYRRRKGYSQAIVTLTDAVTKRRRDYWLGESGTAESRECYHRVIAEWEASGRRLPSQTVDQSANRTVGGIKICEILCNYWRWAEDYYRPHRAGSIKSALRLLRQYFGNAPATRFGPKKLRLLRKEMIRGDAVGHPPRMPWSRTYTNSQVQCIRHLFKWAAARELVPVSVHQSLCTLEPLKRGRTDARETEKVGPVPEELLDGVRPYLSRPVRALVELQLLTGARPGELLGMRAIDIDMDKRTGVWTYRPESHKNAYRELERVIYIGPRAQEIIGPFLIDRPTNAPLFSPAEAEADRRAALHAARKTPLSCGNRPGTNRRGRPMCVAGDRYTTSSYYRAIQHACEKVFPPPAPLGQQPGETRNQWRARLTPSQKRELKALGARPTAGTLTSSATTPPR